MQSEVKSDFAMMPALEGRTVVLEVSPARLRRFWSDAAKARIVEETLMPGASVSAIARANGVRPQQVFTWRRKALQSGQVRSGDDLSPGFARVEAMSEPAAGLVEIAIGDAVIRIRGPVVAEQLRCVIAALRQR